MQFPTSLPKDTSPFLWGAGCGAVALAILGFGWGGWVTGGNAQRNTDTASRSAVVLALAPICVDRFRAQSDVAAKTVELAAANSWERGRLVERDGFATMPGSKTADSDVARACAETLSTPKI